MVPLGLVEPFGGLFRFVHFLCSGSFGWNFDATTERKKNQNDVVSHAMLDKVEVLGVLLGI